MISVCDAWNALLNQNFNETSRQLRLMHGDVIICRRSCAEPGSDLFAMHFLPHDVTFSIHRWCQSPLAEEIDAYRYTSKSEGQNALRPWPWYFLLITRYCFTLCKEFISPSSLCRDSDTLRRPKKSSSTGQVALRYFNRFFFQFIIYVVVPNTILCTIGQWY